VKSPHPNPGLMKTGTGSATACIIVRRQPRLVAVPVPVFITSLLPLMTLRLAVLCLVATVGCTTKDSSDHAATRPHIFVGIPPVGYLVERVAGDHVTVDVLVPAGQDPHTFELTPRQMSALSAAKAFLKVGMPFENQLAERIAQSARGPSIFDVAQGQGIPKRPMDAESSAHNHSAQADDEHRSQHDHHDDKEGGDPHVWLAPALLKSMASNVAAVLIQLDPAHAADFRKNLAQLLGDIDAADAAVAETLKPYRGQTFYVFHPAFGYFADAYGLRQEAIEAAGRAPTPKQLGELIRKAQAEHVKIIFVQPQFDPRSAQAVAEAIGGSVVPIDDLAADVPRNFHNLATKIKRGFDAAHASTADVQAEAGSQAGAGKPELEKDSHHAR
jgi:zinc transport system substrate-binding protein